MGSLVSIKADADLDLAELKRLLQRVSKAIHQAPDAPRAQMNLFVISVGCYVPALTAAAIKAGDKIGPVTIDVSNTACRVPYIPDYIQKVQDHGSIGKKRKTAKC